MLVLSAGAEWSALYSCNAWFEERDFDAIRPVFFSTSQLGQPAPSFGGSTGGTLQDAFDLDSAEGVGHCATCRAELYQRRVSEAA